jgi:ureidoglycolate hydrolase
VFCPNKIVDGADTPDYEKMEAFLITEKQAVVVEKGVWHWTPMPLEPEVSIICSFAEDTQWNDLDVQALPPGEVVQVIL